MAETRSESGKDPKKMAFSSELEAAISDILPSSDPLDQPNFNPVDYINTIFPNEQSLVDLDASIGKLKAKISKTDDEILKAVREQTSAGAKGKKDLEEAKKAIQELFSKINDIKVKAKKSEEMVTELCKDIKSLDYAKKNLTLTITAFRRLQMMITAVDQLKTLATKKQYQEAAQLLEAVNEFQEHFADYKDVTKIAELNRAVMGIRGDLKSMVYEEFRALDMGLPITPILTEACYIIDAFSKDNTKQEFISWFCDKQLSEYRRVFAKGEESYLIGYSDRRFAWLKKALTKFDDEFSKVFPKHWKMDEMISKEFCVLTRLAFTNILEETKDKMDVTALVGTLTKTIQFENEISKRFGVVEEEEEIESEEEEEEAADLADINPNSAAAVRLRYLQHKKQKEKEEKETSRKKKVGKKQQKTPPFKGIISNCFDPYMDIYINGQDKNLNESLTKIMADEQWIVDDDERDKVLSSSGDLIYSFKTAMKQCSLLSKGQPFYDMYNLLKKYLREYANILQSKIPTPEAKLSERDEKMLCLIINTAEKWSELTTEMRETIKRIIQPKFQEKIDFTQEQSDFASIIAKGVKALASGLEVKLEGSLTSMTKMPWSSWEVVGDQSDYVNQMSTYIGQSVPLYGQWLSSTSHFRFFCDSFVLSFIPHLIQTLFKCRRISEVGAQQLMLDFTAIKTILLDLPKSGKPDPNPVSRYSKHVQKEMGKSELLLKVISSPAPALVDTYKALIVEHNEAELQKILDIKGIPRAEQRTILDSYSDHSEKATSKGSSNIRKLLTDVFTTGTIVDAKK